LIRSIRVAALAALLGACGETGSVSIRFDLPDTASLDPFAQPIAELTLTAWSTNGSNTSELVYASTRPLVSRSEPPVFDELPLGNQLRLELTASSATGRTLAFGRSDELIDVTAEDDIEIRIPVRRPFGFVAGGSELLALDAAREPGQGYTSTLDLPEPSSAAAMLRSGTELLVATQSEVLLVSSSTFDVAAAPRADIVAPAEDLAVSPDGRWAVASHFGGTNPETQEPWPTGVTVIDLDALRAGSASPTFIASNPARGVAMTNDTAWVVIDPLQDLFCRGESSILPVDLASAEAGPAIALGVPAGDIAADPRVGALLVLPCANKLVSIAPGATATVDRHELTGISAVTVDRDRIWMTGHVDGEGSAYLSIASAPIEGATGLDILELPVLEERAIATQLGDDGQGGLLKMTADLASAGDITVFPDREHVAVLVGAAYNTTALGDAGGGQPIIPNLTMVTYEYQLVQLSTGLAAQRLRIYCDITWDPGALLDDYVCGQAPGQDISSVQLVPTDLSALYGSR
jgi:hypothetical protein